ncbi:hypothetical protein [Streptomyces sp. KL118A]|uniref:hypothetical protein n=1 Tax=Streptomyces sp. KL118A TaxID=3045153 RepID=UPI00278C5DFE|nr:hypothetical protein [Streptomyces sp. KL118A]
MAVTVTQRFAELPVEQREVGGYRFVDAFFFDLRNSYRRYRHWSTGRILLLLENAETPAAGQLLRHLVQARAAGSDRLTDGLVVVATTGDYAKTLHYAGLGPGLPLRTFDREPPEVFEGLRAASLDLSPRDVLEEVHHAVGESTPATGPNLTGRDIHTFSRTLFDVTRGHPAGTRRIIGHVLHQDPADPWQERLRAALAPGSHLVAELTDLLLPPDLSQDARHVLALAATVPDLALTQEELSLLGAGDMDEELLAARRDPGITLHLDTGDPCRDGPPSTPHPFLRLVLLRGLSAPERTHAVLRGIAERSGDRGRAAYHALASGDLGAAAAYLDQHLDDVTIEEWRAELARLRRAPLYDAGRPAAWPGPDAYLDALLGGSDEYRTWSNPRRRAVTRLLAASWISVEPFRVRAVDEAGNPFRDPLGDPTATLHPLIADELQRLARQAPTGEGSVALRELAEQYRKPPITERLPTHPRREERGRREARLRREARQLPAVRLPTVVVGLGAAAAALLGYLLLGWLPPLGGWGWAVAAPVCWALVLLIARTASRRDRERRPPRTNVAIRAFRTPRHAFLSGVLRSWGIRSGTAAPHSPPTPDPPPQPSRRAAEAAVEQALIRVLARLDAAETDTGDENGPAT